MSKRSQTIKEITQIVVFLLVVGILLAAFVIYPLNRTKAIMARPDVDSFKKDSLPANDPSAFINAGLAVDTFRVEADGLTSLACVRLTSGPEPQSAGTVILLPDERSDRTSVLTLAKPVVTTGRTAITYDPRGTGLSGAMYRSDGQREAADLLEIIAYLEMHGQLVRPVTVIGRGLGAETALLASLEENRIDAVVAINPYLTTVRMIDQYRSDYGTFWLPFFRTVFWWWYDIRCSYGAEMRTIDEIRGAPVPTLVLAPQDALAAPEFARLAEVSNRAKLRVAPLPTADEGLNQEIGKFLSPTPEFAPPKPLMR